MDVHGKDKALCPHGADSLVWERANFLCELVVSLLDYKLLDMYIAVSHRDKCYEEKKQIRVSG